MKKLIGGPTNWKAIIGLLFLIAIVSCDVSPLSHGEIDNLSGIGATISIEQNPCNEKINNISMKLFDKKGKQIGNENITVRVNNTELFLYIVHELYYTKKIRYVADNIPVSDSYYFEVELSDSTILPLAYVKAIQPIKRESVKLAERGAIDLETKIEWEEMKEFDNVLIWKSYKMNDSKIHRGGPYGESSIHKSIEQNGGYVVPISFYRDSVSTITALNFEFHANKEGLINPELLSGSNVTLHSMLVKRIKFDTK